MKAEASKPGAHPAVEALTEIRRLLPGVEAALQATGERPTPGQVQLIRDRVREVIVAAGLRPRAPQPATAGAPAVGWHLPVEPPTRFGADVSGWRWTAERPCLVCGSACGGVLSSEGWAGCTCYTHRLNVIPIPGGVPVHPHVVGVPCPCGETHPAPVG